MVDGKGREAGERVRSYAMGSLVKEAGFLTQSLLRQKYRWHRSIQMEQQSLRHIQNTARIGDA
eukprot:scaffold34666_cov41-Cyclotella_meneghiniana.AAC.2